MQSRKTFNFNSSQNPFNSLISLLVLVGVMVLLFFVVKGFISILYLAAPVLLIITLVINYKIVADYVISIFETFKTDVLMGMVKVAFTFLCYPIVIGWLFAKALLFRKVDKIRQELDSQMGLFEKESKEQYIDFEELNSKTGSEKPEKPNIIGLPNPKEKEKKNPYNGMFDS
jgi:hypothetical protein